MRYNLYIVGHLHVSISEWLYMKSELQGSKIYKSTKIGAPYLYQRIHELKDGVLNCKRLIIGTGGTSASEAGDEYYLVPETHWLFNACQVLDYNRRNKVNEYLTDEFYKLHPGSIVLKN